MRSERIPKAKINQQSASMQAKGIHPTRMTWLCYEPTLYIRPSELQLVALAINEDVCKMQKTSLDIWN